MLNGSPEPNTGSADSIAERISRNAKSAAWKRSARRREVLPVEYVEHFGSELHLEPLVNWDILENRQIHAAIARAIDEVTPQVAEGAVCISTLRRGFFGGC
jgi:hypothetical protein